MTTINRLPEVPFDVMLHTRLADAVNNNLSFYFYFHGDSEPYVVLQLKEANIGRDCIELITTDEVKTVIPFSALSHILTRPK